MAFKLPNLTERRACYSCRRELPIEAFALAKIKGAAYRNRRCNACRAKRQTLTENHLKRKEQYEALKAQPCADCGGRFPTECMDFDHTKGRKSFNLASAWRWMAYDRLQAEIAKCQIVCANCHRIRSRKAGVSRGRPTKYLADVHLDLCETDNTQRRTDAQTQ